MGEALNTGGPSWLMIHCAEHTVQKGRYGNDTKNYVDLPEKADIGGSNGTSLDGIATHSRGMGYSRRRLRCVSWDGQ